MLHRVAVETRQRRRANACKVGRSRCRLELAGRRISGQVEAVSGSLVAEASRGILQDVSDSSIRAYFAFIH
ncbi:unnamed protein product [Protopolystoma xenopodis]|uniref:Uncharacterized protein n=1 Tax=Protopolystoma xenopodis TaxID=117903 RepID=A0A3S5CPX9_9PLAT|nr:unnamed protein product [Protopolystoma xenopodis]